MKAVSPSLLRSLGDGISQGLIGLDQKRRIAYANTSFAKLIQHETSNLVGREFESLFDASQRIELLKKINQNLEGRTQGLFNLSTISGTVRRLSLVFYCQSAFSGTSDEQFATTILVTDLSQSELDGVPSFPGAASPATPAGELSIATQLLNSQLELKQLADVLPQLVFAATPNGDLDWFNLRWTEFTGLSSQELCEGGWQSRHDPKVLPHVLQVWRSTVESGEPNSTTFPLRALDGKFKTFLCRVAPVRDAEGHVTKWFGTCTDIDEQQQLQEELRRIAAELSESDRRKNEFLAILAHELRNPLTPIKSAVQLMQLTDIAPHEFMGLFDIVDRQVTHMSHLIDDLLDISRISRGKINLRLESCELRQILTDAIESVLPLIETSQHRLHLDVTNQSLPVLGDRTRLLQILINLLTNAAKYTQEPGDIWVAANVTRDEVEITIRDSGIGISQEDQGKVFQMFHQVHSDKLDGHSGLGIGLSLVKSLVQMHNGQISVFSPGLGKGATFRLCLPLHAANRQEVAPASPPASLDEPIEPRRILVVDDARGNRVILSRLLRTLGQEVAEASNGAEGLELARTFKPDMVLSDISMPVMNGYEMVRLIRQSHPDILIVALSGFGQDSDLDAALAAGFDKCLVKPVDVADLKKLLRKLN